MIGKTVSHYRIVEKLGEGGMGAVYRAEDTRLGRFVALKFLPASLVSRDEARRRFEHEARTASSLEHPNICTIHDIDVGPDGQTFIVMPAYDGEDLREKLARGPLGLAEVLDIVSQAASGLAKAHEGGIVHRDVKPANIFVTRDGVVKLMDFGIAKLSAQTRLTKTGTTVGTVLYMSPEQAKGEDVDARSDIFSLGIVMYEVLTGVPPFSGEQDAAVLYKLLRNDPEPLTKHRAEVPREVQAIFDKATKRDRNQRYARAHDMMADIERVKRELAGATTRGHGPKRVASPLRLAGAIFLAAVIVGVAYWQLRPRGRDGPSIPDVHDGIAMSRVQLKQITFADGAEEYPAFSPEGERLLYSGEVDNYQQIFVKSIESGQEEQLTRDARDHIQPMWGTTGNTILYVRAREAQGKLEPRVVFGPHDGGDVWLHELDTGKSRMIIRDAYNPAVSPDGRSIAFDASWGGSRHVWVADDQGRNARQVTAGGSEDVSHILPRWSPDGRKIVFQSVGSTNFDVQVVDVETQAVAVVTDDVFMDINPVWSGSGDAIYFSSVRGGGMNVWRIAVSADGARVASPRQITAGAGQDVQLAGSPGGRRLAMSILRINADLWRLPVSRETGEPTGEPVALIETTREESRGAWSPDGRSIAFNSDRDGYMNIWIYSFEDRTSRQLTKGPGGDYQARWKSDASTVVFFSSRAGNPDIWTADVASGALTQLTKRPSLETNPVFSPDGTYIAYQSDDGGRKEVWVMNADGGDQRPLSNTGTADHFMLWSPDSRYVVARTLFGSTPNVVRLPVAGGEAEALVKIAGGAHMSFSPDCRSIMDVSAHKTMWVTPLDGAAPRQVFEFADPDVRIDYPNWSPDGAWVLFDRVKPQGGDIWLVEGFE